MDVKNNMEASYGVTRQNKASCEQEYCIEELERLGFTLLDSGYSQEKIAEIQNSFELIRQQYNEKYGLDLLKIKDEHNGIRLPLALNSIFLELVFNDQTLKLINSVMGKNFLLNQQNGVINPAKKAYNQAAWHRDLPYQHYTSSRPLAINALYCVDDFTLENGGTKVVPGSHLHEEFPSELYVKKNKIQISAKAGSFIILDCMLYHSGGINNGDTDRRAVNHVYSSPMIKQQIELSSTLLAHYDLTSEQEHILGLHYNTVKNVDSYIHSRPNKK